MTKTEKTIPSIEHKEEKRSTVDPDCGWFRKHLFCFGNEAHLRRMKK